MGFKRFVPAPLQPVARSLYHALFRTRLRTEWWLRDRLERRPAGMAVPPARLRFRVGEDSRLSAFLEVGRHTANNIEAVLSDAGFEFTPDRRVLDFGCGCGRTLRFLMERLPQLEWHGVDVDAEAIEWCRAHLPGGQFACGQPLPPLPFEGAAFDLIYAISVFTHLNEDFQRAWIVELARILKPGGMLLLSVYSENVWRSQPEAAAVEAGRFVFRESEKLKGILPDWYHTALQNRERITSLLAGRFSRISFHQRGLGDHDAVIAWKAGGAD